MGDDHAPAAAGLDLGDSFCDEIEVIPAENTGFGGGCRDAFRLVGDTEHADPACLVEIHRFGRFGVIHSGPHRETTHFFGDLFCAHNTFPPGIHRVVVPDTPDVRMDIFQDARRRGIHAVKEDSAGSVILRVDQCAFHICDSVISAVEKIEDGGRQQMFILPAVIHVAVKSDISGKNDRCFLFFHGTTSYLASR